MDDQTEAVLTGKKVLLIEDELFIRELYALILKHTGAEIIEAEDGEKGLTLARDKPNLVLLDIMLPKLNGIEVLRRLKSDPATKDIPVVLLTNLGQENIIKEAFSLGAQGYFLKMRISPADLAKYVRAFLSDPKLKMDVNTLPLD